MSVSIQTQSLVIPDFCSLQNDPNYCWHCSGDAADKLTLTIRCYCPLVSITTHFFHHSQYAINDHQGTASALLINMDSTFTLNSIVWSYNEIILTQAVKSDPYEVLTGAETNELMTVFTLTRASSDYHPANSGTNISLCAHCVLHVRIVVS